MNISELSKKYQKKSPIELVLDKPAMFIGSMDPDIKSNWRWNPETEKMDYDEQMVYSHGLLQIFREILMNAVDQSKRTETLTQIKISINEESNTIEIYNNGEGIPIAIHEEHKVYIPEMLFSHFASSSNYDDTQDRTVSGTHGIGAKATVVFSKYFKIETVDSERKKKFIQVYENNLTKIHPYKIRDYTGNPYTRVTFIPDLERFKVKCLDPDLIAMMMKDVYDTCILTDPRVNVYWNGNKIGIKNLNDYVSLYVGKDTVRVAEEQSIVVNKNKTKYDWKYIVCQNTTNVDGFRHVSFVNGIPTRDAGTHVDYIVKQITSKLAETANKKNKDLKVREVDIKNHMFLFLIATVKNPSFPNQIKEKLSTKASAFGCVIEVSEKFVKNVLTKCGIVDAAVNLVKFKEEKKLASSDGRQRSDIGKIPKYESANWAGTKKSKHCTLILTEGDSAKSSVMSGINILGRDKYGVFALKGKLINVRDKSIAQISNNEEIQNIKKIVGLRQGMVYDANKTGLRYHKIMIITDADVDGTHIKGLLINFIQYYWPSLVELNSFITCMATPIIKATNKKKTIEFYAQSDYEQWKSTFEDPEAAKELKKYEIKYYKGLGTSTKKEFESYCEDPKIIQYIWDNKSQDAIELAFLKKKADDRKEWLKSYNPDEIIDYTTTQLSLPDFVNRELKHFSEADNIRSLPSLVDGLKPSMRKIVFAAFEKGLKKEMKVAQFAGFVGERTCYHHGEASLMATIIGLAQDFVGSNNINILEPVGQFGTRVKGGHDAASARYINTKINPLAYIIFNSKDFPLLKYLDDDGTSIEPMWYTPIIPMILVNGTQGIGTGFSTSIPCYNPKDIVMNILRKIDQEPIKKMKPWYRGFKGIIERNGSKGYISKGIFKKTGDKIMEITELPIGVWTDPYMDFIDTLVLSKKDPKKSQILKNVKTYNSDTEVHIILEFIKPINQVFRDTDEVERGLKLTHQLNTSNMNLYDANNVIKKYKSPEEIIDEFYVVRLQQYIYRRKYILTILRREMKILETKAKFILFVSEGKIVVNKRSKQNIIEQLTEHEFPTWESLNDKEEGDEMYDYLLRMPLYNLTIEKIEEFMNRLQAKKSEYNTLKSKTPEDLWREDLNEFYEAYTKE